jgi:GT2 family glycosyltransferase
VKREAAGSPRVYVVLVNWNGAEDTVECLDSLLDLDYPNFRIVVCDNASTDGSVEHIKRWVVGEERFSRPAASPLAGPAFRSSSRPDGGILELDRAATERGDGDDRQLTLILTGDNLGFAGGNNVGLRWIRARGDAEYVWLLNNDTVVHPGALRALISSLETDPDLGAAGSKLLMYNEPNIVQAAGGGMIIAWQGMVLEAGEFEPDDGRWDEQLQLDFLSGASLCIRMDALGQVGLLDEHYFMYSEDIDWCERCRRAGWQLVYEPKSVVWHKVNRSVGGASPKRDYFAVRSGLLWVRKFYPRYQLLATLYGVYRFMVPKLARGQFRRLGAVFRAYADFLSARPDRWRDQR